MKKMCIYSLLHDDECKTTLGNQGLDTGMKEVAKKAWQVRTILSDQKANNSFITLETFQNKRFAIQARYYYCTESRLARALLDTVS
jgi:hypothetical protein